MCYMSCEMTNMSCEVTVGLALFYGMHTQSNISDPLFVFNTLKQSLSGVTTCYCNLHIF